MLLLLACETEELEKRLEFLAQFPEDAKSRAPLDERVLELLHANPSSSAASSRMRWTYLLAICSVS